MKLHIVTTAHQFSHDLGDLHLKKKPQNGGNMYTVLNQRVEDIYEEIFIEKKVKATNKFEGKTQPRLERRNISCYMT